jgi:formylglycine-generating enzyme required for sulfatase activity
MKTKLILHIQLLIGMTLFSCSFNPFDPHKTFCNLSIQVEGNGTAALDPPRTRVYAGTGVTVTARPDSGFVFVGFFGDVRSTTNPLELSVSRDLAIVVRFAHKPAADMAGIPSAGRTFIMGSSSAASQGDERPPHQVRFTYNYFIDKCEITQGLYKSLMGTNPSVVKATQGTFGVGDSVPVYYVSWYDAALFCNSRSKKDGYDTVYSYSAACRPGQDCPYVLQDLAVHYDRLGYRLPTEAEWEFAARAGSTTEYFWGDAETGQATASSYAWYTQNSGGRLHPVGRTSANAFGLFDMAGNVSEFVDDWLGAYSDSLAINPIGPANRTFAQFEATGSRPVRGGCFELGASYLRSSNRSEPYPMPAFTASRHVGFRTVLGVFFADSIFRTDNAVADSLHITLQCAKSDLISAMATGRVKIAFVKQENDARRLCYIDFTEPTPLVRELRDSIPANGPTISPNGSWVAASSKGIGYGVPSQLTVRRLNDSLVACIRTSAGAGAYLPTWWTDTVSPDTFIVYTTGATMNNSPVWKTEKTLMRKFSAFSFPSNPVVLSDTGSFSGGMSKNGEFCASGYPNAFLYDRKWNDLWRYFLPPFSGRDDTAQVCNVSLTPGIARPDEILLLDFGYGRTSTIVGKPYGFHSVLFRCNSLTQQPAHVSRWYEAPKGFTEWDDVRWSNHPDFAVAVAKSEGSGSASSIFIINLRDSTYLKVASGDGLGEPCLWIDPGALSEQPDPYAGFAKYDVAVRVPGQVYLTEKLKLFWTRYTNIDVGVFGSSPTYCGVDPSAMTSFRAINMATLMGELLTSEVLTMDYFLVHVPHLKAVVMGLDPGFLNSDFYPAAPFLNGLYESEGFQFDKAYDFWRSGVPAPVAQKISAFNSSSWPDFDSTGFPLARVVGGWGAPVIDKADFPFSDTFIQANLASIETTADTLAARGIHCFVVEYPENPAYKTTVSVGRYGPSHATYDTIGMWLRALERKNPYFHFYDANNNGDHDYSDAEALDANHLGYLGARKLSRRLDSLLSVYVK